jgi:UDP-2,3-diacylglucosamine pyrophosphatase LpxH
VIFLPGNHDEGLRAYCGSRFGGIEIENEIVHTTADGRRMLVIHGDQFDVVVCNARWLAFLGDIAYEMAMAVSSGISYLRRRAGLKHWSLSAYLKQKVKHAVCFIGDYEAALIGAARRSGTDGVICGHIHHAAIRDVDGILYVNLGDWVESATAVGETEDGRFEIIRWIDVVEERRLAEQKMRGALPAAA